MEAVCSSEIKWFVMRDLKRANAKLPAYRQLSDAGFRVFTPMTSKVIESGGKRRRTEVPFVRDLLFVYSDKESLDRIVECTETLQYRFVKGAAYRTPMVVAASDMERFIAAVTAVSTPQYYQPDEITPTMCGARVRMICDGPFNGLEGTLLKVRGSGKKRLLVRLPGVLAAAVEVQSADYVELV